MSAPVATSTLSMQSFFSTTLSSAISSSDTVIPLSAVPNGTEGFLVIDQDNSSKEIIYYNTKGGSSVTIPSVSTGRAQGGTTAVSHLSGATVKMNMVDQYWSELQNGHAMKSTAFTPAKTVNPYKFSAYASVATSMTAGFVPTKITFGTEEYDTGGNFASSTFTAPVAGFYQFSAQIQSSSGAANEFYNIFLYKNGSVYKSGTGHNSTIAGTVLESVSPPPISLAANDTIEIYAAQNSAGAKNTITGADKTYFGGYLVSAT